MIKPYLVTIRRTIVTKIVVDATSADEAKKTVEQYDALCACSDYPVDEENAECKIVTAKLKKRGT